MSAGNPFGGDLGTSRHPTAAVAPLQQRHEQFASILMPQDAAESAQIPQTIDTLEMMPSTLQDYFNGVDLGIDSCRDLLTNTDWNFDFNDVSQTMDKGGYINRSKYLNYQKGQPVNGAMRDDAKRF